MKSCPKCAFIYEDEQTTCDMDGRKLVSYSPSVPVESKEAPTRLTIAVPPPSGSRRLPIVIATSLVLVVLLGGLFFAQLKLRPGENAADELDLAALGVPPIKLPTDPGIRVALQTDQPTNSPDSSTASETADLSQPKSAPTSASRLRAISSGGSAGTNQGPVFLRLTNGATIKADEVWERKDGVWYRQGGVLTFLKHSQVRSIDRSGTAPSRSSDQRNLPQPVLAQNRTPAPRTQVVEVKKESRVSSFLKKTGRVLKKPFKF